MGLTGNIKMALKSLLEWTLWYPGHWLMSFFWRDRLPYELAAFGGRVRALLARGRRRVLQKELNKSARALQLSQTKINKAISRSMILDAVDQLEILNYPRFGAHADGKALTLERISSIQGLEHLDAASAKGGVILVHLHFGAMQMILPALAHLGYHVAQVGNSRLAVLDDPGKVPFPWLRAVLTKQKRFEESLPAPFLYTGKDTLKIVRWLKAGKIVDIAIDGRVGTNWIETKFIGRLAAFPDNPFRLAQLTGASLLPAFIIRNPEDFRLRIVIETPIPGAKGETAREYKKMLETFLLTAEKYIRDYPCHFCRRLWVMQRQKPYQPNPLFLD